jgi:hypothetical protein
MPVHSLKLQCFDGHLQPSLSSQFGGNVGLMLNCSATRDAAISRFAQDVLDSDILQTCPCDHMH